jgi:hypothetical protein
MFSFCLGRLFLFLIIFFLSLGDDRQRRREGSDQLPQVAADEMPTGIPPGLLKLYFKYVAS